MRPLTPLRSLRCRLHQVIATGWDRRPRRTHQLHLPGRHGVLAARDGDHESRLYGFVLFFFFFNGGFSPWFPTCSNMFQHVVTFSNVFQHNTCLNKFKYLEVFRVNFSSFPGGWSRCGVPSVEGAINAQAEAEDEPSITAASLNWWTCPRWNIGCIDRLWHAACIVLLEPALSVCFSGSIQFARQFGHAPQPLQESTGGQHSLGPTPAAFARSIISPSRPNGHNPQRCSQGFKMTVLEWHIPPVPLGSRFYKYK